MTNAKTDYHEAQVMDRIFANAAPDGANDGVYVALWGTNPANSPDNTNEISGDSYSVVQLTASNWSVSSASAPREYQNDVDIDFGVLDTSTSTTVEGVVLYDGADTGTSNALYFDDNFGSETVSAGDEFKLGAGNVTVSED